MAAAQRDRQFKVLKFVGKGSYGSVFLVQRLADSQTYALKEMDVRSMSQAEREDSINEIRLLASVSHPNVISYNEAFLDGNRLCIIMEYAADGDLAKVIKKQQMMKRPLPEDVIWRYIIQVVLGLQALHNMKILHRDIKPGNIMVFESGVVKIGDLGIAKLLTKTAAAKTQIGTPHYMGPEIWKNRPYSYTSDTWAVGCLLYELTTLSVPFEARSMSELRYKVLRGSYPAIPNTFSRDLQQLVRECLDPNPDKRPTMDAILASPAVASRLKLVPHESRNPPPTAGSALVETIKVPRGNIAAIKNKLPPAQYATDMLNMGGPGGVQAGGHHHHHQAQMTTIEEGSEEDTPPSRPGAGQGQGAVPRPMGQQRQQSAAASRQQAAQPLPPMPPLPKPNYPPPPVQRPSYAAAAPAAAQQLVSQGGQQAFLGKLPQLPGVVPQSAAGVSDPGGAGGGYGNRPAQMRPSYMAAAAGLPPPSQGAASGWSYGGMLQQQQQQQQQLQQQQQGKVSESHANYGAFYHHPNPYPPQQQQQQQQAPAAWQAGNKWPPQPQQPAVQYQSPYISPYGQQRHYGGPTPGGGGGGGGVPHLPQINAGPRQAVPVSRMPPWNYGAMQVVAPRRPARGQPAPAARPTPGYYGAGGGGGGGEGQYGEVPRYPPPQWAPRPARW